MSDVVVNGIEMEEHSESIEGLNGSFDMGAVYKGREISVPFSFQGQNLGTYSVFRDLIYQLTTSTEPYYIQEMRRPKKQGYTFKEPSVDSSAYSKDQYGRLTVFDAQQTDNELSSGKRYLVRLSGAVEIEQSKHTAKGKGELTFHTVELPFGESVGTSLELEQGLRYGQVPMWAYGMNLEYGTDKMQFTFKPRLETEVTFYNIGDVPVDQFNQHFRIIMKFQQDVPNNFQFGINSLNCQIDHEANIKKGDVVIFQNGSVTKNGLSIINHTNFGEIEAQVGANKFMMNTHWDVDVSLDLRFYYL